MLAAGVDKAVVSEICGHSGIAITSKYYAFTLDRSKNSAVDALVDVLSPAGLAPSAAFMACCRSRGFAGSCSHVVVVGGPSRMHPGLNTGRRSSQDLGSWGTRLVAALFDLAWLAHLVYTAVGMIAV